MRKFGLIGYPLEHSFSKKYFTEKFQNEKIKNCRYLNFPIDSIDKFPALISENKDLVGLNVTIPYKEKVIHYLDIVDNIAKEIGAVNTIKIERHNNNYTLKGYNTDVFGFYSSLIPLVKKIHEKALILGTGGASKAIAYVLDKMDIKYIYVSRNPRMENHINYKDLNSKLMDNYKIIINTSPLGMFPEIDKFPDIPYNNITKDHLLYDLVYNPEMSIFLEKGAERGAVIKNGLLMLHLQAEKAWEIWNS